MKHKHLLIFVLSVMLFLGLSFSLLAQDEQAEDQGAEETQQELKRMPKAALKMLNLTEEEAAQTTHGKKLKVYMLRLDNLKAFQSGDKAKNVLLDTEERVIPIYAGNVLKTSISIRKGKDKWKTASMGGAEIQLLEPIRKAHAAANNIDEKSYFIVRVPALYLVFLGYEQKGDIVLIPANESPDLNLEVGKSVPAEEIFLKIQPLVGEYENVVVRPKKK